jgi:hypothetical protein
MKKNKKSNEQTIKKEESKTLSAKEFDSVMKQILSAPPQVKKKKEKLK